MPLVVLFLPVYFLIFIPLFHLMRYIKFSTCSNAPWVCFYSNHFPMMLLLRFRATIWRARIFKHLGVRQSSQVTAFPQLHSRVWFMWGFKLGLRSAGTIWLAYLTSAFKFLSLENIFFLMWNKEQSVLNLHDVKLVGQILVGKDFVARQKNCDNKMIWIKGIVHPKMKLSSEQNRFGEM